MHTNTDCFMAKENLKIFSFKEEPLNKNEKKVTWSYIEYQTYPGLSVAIDCLLLYHWDMREPNEYNIYKCYITTTRNTFWQIYSDTWSWVGFKWQIDHKGVWCVAICKLYRHNKNCTVTLSLRDYISMSICMATFVNK